MDHHLVALKNGEETYNMKAKTGDIILVSGIGLLPRGIQFFMNIYRKRLGLTPRKLYNHVAVVVELWCTLWIAEASAKGVRVFKYPDDYIRRQDVKVMQFKKPLSEIEQRKFSEVAIKYALHPTRYDLTNFWHQMIFILTGKWNGKVNAASRGKLYCSEFAAVVMDEVRNSFSGVTWDKNPLDIEICQELEFIYLDPKRSKE